MKKTIISAVMLLAGAGLFAQNLDPTVVVTNTYAQQAGAVEKPSQLFEMPDSVMRFNLDFDYSALSVPYRGAYEFKPYLVELRPTQRPSTEGTLFLNVGAGYTLHPELTAIWTPVRKDYFKLNLYADHQSYFGQYRNIAANAGWFDNTAGGRFSGARSHSVAGVNTLFTWIGGRLEADIHYRNIYAADKYVPNAAFNALDFGIQVESDPDASLYYIVKNTDSVMWFPFGKEVHSKTSAGIGTHFGEHYLRLGVLADIVASNPGSAGNIAFTPRYIFNHKDFSFDLGVKVSFMFRSDGTYYPVANYPGGFVFPLFPDVRIKYCVVPDALALYAQVTGGHIMHTYESLASQNPFISSFAGTMDASVERCNANIGMRGNISARFHYDLGIGYAFRENAFLWGFTELDEPAFGYAPKYHLFYANLSTGWKGESVDLDVNVLFQKSSLKEERLFSPAVFQGNARFLYNWGGRIRAGVTLDAMTEREALRCTLPGYVDLGLLGDLQMTQSLGLWIKAGNLLNQAIQRIPFYAESGIYVSAGIRLTL